MNERSPLERLPAVRSYLERIGARMTSLFRAATIERIGRYEREVNVVRFNRSGEVFAPDAIVPTATEATDIANQIAEVDLPRHQTLTAIDEASLPEPIATAEPTHRFDILNRKGEVVMIQVRVDKDNGDKRYVPWTYWTDGQWRPAEPEERLPVYGAQWTRGASRIFIHEGAKAARAAQRIAEDQQHPFHKDFSTGAHVGWIGGAHQAHRADWADIRGADPDDVVVVCDNDFDGIQALPVIARQFRCPVRAIIWDDTLPSGWDVAEPVPDEKFYNGYYIWQYPLETARPIDWATDQIPQPQGRPIIRIRENFARGWVRVSNIRRFAHMANPARLLDREGFNAAVAKFSHTPDTARYLLAAPHREVDAVTFEPASPRIFERDGDRYLNCYTDLRLRPMPGETEIWDRFMEYLFPVEEDRAEVIRWMATVYALPATRVNYGLLLLSKGQGVGKSTIGEVMRRLVGPPQCSTPGDSVILSDFTGWLENKRLVVVHEIYAGHSWQAYNKLKSLLTDDVLEINVKHQPTYSVPNCTSFICASNSMEALRIERDDRRWLVPKVETEKWNIKDYRALWAWIRGGGLHGLAHSFLGRSDYVQTGEFAPGGASKQELIDASRPEEELLLEMLLDELKPDEIMVTGDVWMWLREQTKGKIYSSPNRLASIARDLNRGVSSARVRVDSDRKQRLIANTQAEADAFAETDKATRDKNRVDPNEVFERRKPM